MYHTPCITPHVFSGFHSSPQFRRPDGRCAQSWQFRRPLGGHISACGWDQHGHHRQRAEPLILSADQHGTVGRLGDPLLWQSPKIVPGARIAVAARQAPVPNEARLRKESCARRSAGVHRRTLFPCAARASFLHHLCSTVWQLCGSCVAVVHQLCINSNCASIVCRFTCADIADCICCWLARTGDA